MGIRGGGAARQIQSLLDVGAIGGMGDGELLGRFLGRGDSAEPAFAALVDRHGRMVLRVCLDVLGDPHEAQDAAQATFFILARKAGAIRRPEALPSWLHGTARRVASRALHASIRRRKHERRVAQAAPMDSTDEPPRTWPELHEELARLPDRYREPIVLCDLAGMTHEQAAGKLGCPARTLETRLYRGRERLKDRLVRRGFAPSAAPIGLAWASETQGALPSGWAASTASASVRLAKGGWAAAGEEPADAVRWARDHLKESVMFKIKCLVGAGLLAGLAWQQASSQVPAQKTPARVAAEPAAQKEPPQPFIDPDRPKVYGWPISVSGHVRDRDGKPIAGARVYVASRKGEYKGLGSVKTNEEGYYAFSLPLPIERADTVTGRDHGVFQVFGEASGYGFTFRPAKYFFPYAQPSNITYEPNNQDPPWRYESGDRIVQDLKFSPAAHLAGTIVDDLDRPLAGVHLEIRNCETGVALDDKSPWSFETLNEPDSAPASMKIRTTDKQGRFDFDALPPDCRFRIMADLKGFPTQGILAATALASPRNLFGSPVQTGELKVVMTRPMDVPIKLVLDDTGAPAVKALVGAGGSDSSDSETADDKGLATLRLPPGDYRIECLPARGTPYLVSEFRFFLGVAQFPEPVVFRLRRASELEVTVVDEATGKGLSGVDLWHETKPSRREEYGMRSWEVATRIAWYEVPRTDADGKLRAFVEPGKHRFGVAKEAYPKGYSVVERDGQEVECVAGETSKLQFTLRARK